MKVYTGYYAKLNTYINAGLVPIAVSRTIPSGIGVHLCMSELAPSFGLLRAYKDGELTEQEYRERYFSETLKVKSIPDLCYKLHDLTDGKDCVLLCYESSDKFCHRHLIAEVMNKVGIPVNEYPI